MNFYLVTYMGFWLGGKAVVAANTPEEALNLVEQDSRTVQFRKSSAGMRPVTYMPVVTQINVPGPCVLYNDNGDY